MRRKNKTFEAGIGQAMVAVLASPRFLIREEGTEQAGHRPGGYVLLDEYSLASRLSYFLWSTMPDEELMTLAAKEQLRQNLPAQLSRMLADKRSKEFVRNFTGQWLKARDIDNVQIDSRTVLQREKGADPEMEKLRRRYRELEDQGDEALSQAEKDEKAQPFAPLFFKRFGHALRPSLTTEMRTSMREETEEVFNYIFREDRSLLELIDSDYPFHNARLAQQYGITTGTGEEMRRVTLPPDSPRGGILTEGTVLIVTSNPTRTSPVKRGLFILDNILGTPPPPPPPNIPPLEDAAECRPHLEPPRNPGRASRQSVVRFLPQSHGPLGLAMENFNALGMWQVRSSSSRLIRPAHC